MCMALQSKAQPIHVSFVPLLNPELLLVLSVHFDHLAGRGGAQSKERPVARLRAHLARELPRPMDRDEGLICARGAPDPPAPAAMPPRPAFALRFVPGGSLFHLRVDAEASPPSSNARAFSIATVA